MIFRCITCSIRSLISYILLASTTFYFSHSQCFFYSLLSIIQSIFWLPSLAHQYLPFSSVTDKRLLSATLRLIKVHSITCLNDLWVFFFKLPCQMCLACGAGSLQWWVSASSAMLLLMAGGKVPGGAFGRKSLGLPAVLGVFTSPSSLGMASAPQGKHLFPTIPEMPWRNGRRAGQTGLWPTKDLSAQGRNAAASTWRQTLTWQHYRSRFTGGD